MGKSSDRKVRSVAFDPAVWEWLQAEGERTGRGTTKELNLHLQWAIALREKGHTPEGADYYNQIVETVRDQIKDEVLYEMRVQINALLQLEEEVKYLQQQAEAGRRDMKALLRQAIQEEQQRQVEEEGLKATKPPAANDH